MLHHRKPNRLHGFNYAQDRLYFITSCVHDRVCIFGEVIANQMILNECGMIADRQWYWLENQYPYVRVHTHIVMPNHVHAIIEINRDLFPNVRTGRDQSIRDLSLHSESNIKIKSLSELIGAYKTTSSKQIHLIQTPDGSYPYQSFCWQRSFHDRIIRNQKEYERIVTYIDQNPLSWSQDEFYR